MAPENSIRAFLLADELGVNGIELDVQLSAVGVPVILQDPFVWTDGAELLLRPAEERTASMRRLWIATCSWGPIDLVGILDSIPAMITCIDRPFLTRGDVVRWRDEGLEIYVGGSDLVGDLTEMLSWPVSGVFLDAPTLGRAVIAGRGGKPADFGCESASGEHPALYQILTILALIPGARAGDPRRRPVLAACILIGRWMIRLGSPPIRETSSR